MINELGNLYILSGLPACGKTTWAKGYLTDNPLRSVVRISRADIQRDMFRPGYGMPDKEIESIVTSIQRSAITTCLSTGVDVIVDDTNLRSEEIASLMKLAFNLGANFEVLDFYHVSLATCLNRNRNRPLNERVGEEVIRKMHAELMTRLAEEEATEALVNEETIT